MTIADVFSSLTTVFDLLMDQFSTTVSTITGNPLLYVSVLAGLGGGLILAGIKFVRRLGVRGFGSGRRRRR